MSEFAAKIDRFALKYFEKYGNSGILRVTSKDVTLYERYLGYANRESQVPFCKDSMFAFYSLSKPFLAIGLMKLYEDGLISIDRHPGDYLQEAKGFDERVTIRHMLHHVSGLPDFTLTANFAQKYESGNPEQLRDQLLELTSYPMVFEPGTKTMYANINMILCALIIENVTGMPYDMYMKETVFFPLGMSACIDKYDLTLPCRVTGYERCNDKIIPVRSCLNWMHGAGDIIGTVDDVYCLNRAIKHRLLLTKETWDEILHPWSDKDTYGMGCRITQWHGKTRITHNGGHVGFRTLHIQLPEDDLDIIYMSNAAWGDARTDLAEAVYSAFYGEDLPVESMEMDKGYI